jgi:peroxiredoxin
MTALFKKGLRVGDKAPDFELPSHLGGKVKLSSFRGQKNLLIAFYPMDWTPVCTNQIPGFEHELNRFEELDTQPLAISVDSVPCHQAWQKTMGGITYPLLADNAPHGAVSKAYGVLIDESFADRVIFIIDKEGIIKYINEVGMSNLPNNEEVFHLLESL